MFSKSDLNGEGFITDGRGAWFDITDVYETTTHTDSYLQVALNKLSSIKFFYKSRNDATISIVFNKFFAALCDYKYAGRTPETLDERTCLTLLNSLIKPVTNLHCHINICEIVDNKVFGFTSQQVMDAAVLEYSKVPVTTKYYAKAQSYD